MGRVPPQHGKEFAIENVKEPCMRSEEIVFSYHFSEIQTGGFVRL